MKHRNKLTLREQRKQELQLNESVMATMTAAIADLMKNPKVRKAVKEMSSKFMAQLKEKGVDEYNKFKDLPDEEKKSYVENFFNKASETYQDVDIPGTENVGKEKGVPMKGKEVFDLSSFGKRISTPVSKFFSKKR
tara:strand:+ start:1928 stop:2335 length:408 start_codon:yes stop_codon:yes gene_type:complete